MDPLGYTMAVDATLRHVLSARPDAPQVTDPPPRPHPVRAATAALLRRLADRVEPRPVCARA
ncbi:hypothetical protein [Rhizomonospora bruguierae]|uniref:hypothetical protein n=1 Tax=Rhizomonospora bruguierae TaxID=1581705 RepID=UPI001BCAE704|nr:hypothetical protein [Micromonospora sp. NBRC 107566]